MNAWVFIWAIIWAYVKEEVMRVAVYNGWSHVRTILIQCSSSVVDDIVTCEPEVLEHMAVSVIVIPVWVRVVLRGL